MISYNFYVLFDNRFDKFQFLFFEPVIGDHLDGEYVVFCLVSIFYHMDMDRSMVIGIKVESYSRIG